MRAPQKVSSSISKHPSRRYCTTCMTPKLPQDIELPTDICAQHRMAENVDISSERRQSSLQSHNAPRRRGAKCTYFPLITSGDRSQHGLTAEQIRQLDMQLQSRHIEFQGTSFQVHISRR